jgi:hypothetical protein
MINNSMKITCRDCNTEVDEIVAYSTKCRPCTKEDAHWRHIKAAYGMSKLDWTFLYESQNGKCAICGSENFQDSKKNRLSVDHAHPYGQARGDSKVKKEDIRGLLCHDCNIALGAFRHNVSALKNAIDYLESHKCIE